MLPLVIPPLKQLLKEQIPLRYFLQKPKEELQFDYLYKLNSEVNLRLLTGPGLDITLAGIIRIKSIGTEKINQHSENRMTTAALKYFGL